MDDITNRWTKFSLSNKEGKKVILSRGKQIQEFVLVAKFLLREQ